MLTLTATGYCYHNGKSDQRAAGCIILRYLLDDSRVLWREIAQALGPVTTPAAELISAIAALKAVRPEYRAVPTIFCVSEYVHRMLVRNPAGGQVVVDYKYAAKTNPQLVARLRACVEEFPHINVQVLTDYRALEISKANAKNQVSSDTGNVLEAADLSV